MFDYVRLCSTMFDYVRLLVHYVRLCSTMFDYVRLCSTYVQLCSTKSYYVVEIKNICSKTLQNVVYSETTYLSCVCRMFFLVFVASFYSHSFSLPNYCPFLTNFTI